MKKVKIRILVDDYPDEISVGDVVDAYVWEGVPYPYYVTRESQCPAMNERGEVIWEEGFLIWCGWCGDRRMTLLFNFFPFILVIVMGLIIHFFTPSKVGKVFMGAITVMMLVVYFQIQPSYMPKGVAKPAAPIVEFTIPEGEITDRLLKPVEAKDRDDARQAEYDKAEERRQQFLKSLKEE